MEVASAILTTSSTECRFVYKHMGDSTICLGQRSGHLLVASRHQHGSEDKVSWSLANLMSQHWFYHQLHAPNQMCTMASLIYTIASLIYTMALQPLVLYQRHQFFPFFVSLIFVRGWSMGQHDYSCIVVHIWTCPLLADCLGKWYLFISLEHPAIPQQQCYRCCSENKHAQVSNLYSCLIQ